MAFLSKAFLKKSALEIGLIFLVWLLLVIIPAELWPNETAGVIKNTLSVIGLQQETVSQISEGKYENASFYPDQGQRRIRYIVMVFGSLIYFMSAAFILIVAIPSIRRLYWAIGLIWPGGDSKPSK